jgi:hypothetical protein
VERPGNAVAVVAIVAVAVLLLTMEGRPPQHPHEKPSREQDVNACVQNLPPQDRTGPVVAHCRSDPFGSVSTGEP